MITGLLVLAALAFLFWPKGGAKSLPAMPSAEDLFRVPPMATPAAPVAPNAREAIDSLLEVRDQLAAVKKLDEEASKAVDTLWLDLLHGSEKK
jgi:hypothetical protein